MKILIADDHRLFREALKYILGAELPAASFGEASTGPATVQLASAQPWDLVVLDINMPGRTGVEVLKDLKALQPHLPVLVITGNPEEQFAVRMVRAGAAGYLTKDSSPEQLVAAVRAIAAGAPYITPTVAHCLAAHVQAGGPTAEYSKLSDREFAVLRLIGAGKSVSRIAAEMSLSVKTVSTYRRRLLAKLQLADTPALMRYAIEHQLAPLPPGR